jgi:hypothetical protein
MLACYAARHEAGDAVALPAPAVSAVKAKAESSAAKSETSKAKTTPGSKSGSKSIKTHTLAGARLPARGRRAARAVSFFTSRAEPRADVAAQASFPRSAATSRRSDGSREDSHGSSEACEGDGAKKDAQLNYSNQKNLGFLPIAPHVLGCALGCRLPAMYPPPFWGAKPRKGGYMRAFNGYRRLHAKVTLCTAAKKKKGTSPFRRQAAQCSAAGALPGWTLCPFALRQKLRVAPRQFARALCLPRETSGGGKRRRGERAGPGLAFGPSASAGPGGVARGAGGLGCVVKRIIWLARRKADAAEEPERGGGGAAPDRPRGRGRARGTGEEQGRQQRERAGGGRVRCLASYA